MTRYEFSVIKYVPDIARFEPVNIGVALLDMDNMVIHNRFITDFSRFFSRLGVDRINGLERSFEHCTPEVSANGKDHLWKIYEASNGSMFYSKPAVIARLGEMPDSKSMLGRYLTR